MSRRLIDIVVGGLGIVVAAPIMLMIAVLIALDDGRPVLFGQTRLGVRRQPFRILKFRSMRDGRVTRTGRWLRSTGLDELPQLANVVAGDMSLIGPRPLTEDDVARLGWTTRRHALRWSIRPGIVGLAQIHAGRGARLSWYLDRRYVEARGLLADLGIVTTAAAMSVLGKRRIKAWRRRARERRRAMLIRFAELARGRRSSARLTNAGRPSPIARNEHTDGLAAAHAAKPRT